MADFSSLISGTIKHHGKYNNRQGRDIHRVILHHWAGTAGGDKHLENPKVKASTNYLIFSDGTAKGQVPEEFRAWTSGSFEADAGAITFEVQNKSTGGQWPVTEAAMDMIVKLLADIAKRYDWGAVAQRSLIGHRDVMSTTCPGPFLYSRLGDFRAAANVIINGGGTVPTVPTTPPTSGKSVWQLADEVLQGLHGNGDERKRSLGTQYAQVQREVNRRLNAGTVSKTPTPSKTVAQLADEVIAGAHGNGDARKKSLGSRYNEVQAEVNRRLGGGRPKSKSVAQLANEVLRGVHGNGDQRKKSLGSQYAAVQAEVNRRLGV